MLTSLVYTVAGSTVAVAWIKFASMFFVSAELVKAVIQ